MCNLSILLSKWICLKSKWQRFSLSQNHKSITKSSGNTIKAQLWKANQVLYISTPKYRYCVFKDLLWYLQLTTILHKQYKVLKLQPISSVIAILFNLWKLSPTVRNNFINQLSNKLISQWQNTITGVEMPTFPSSPHKVVSSSSSSISTSPLSSSRRPVTLGSSLIS